MSDAASLEAQPASTATDDAFLGGALNVLQPTPGLSRGPRRRAAGRNGRGRRGRARARCGRRRRRGRPRRGAAPCRGAGDAGRARPRPCRDGARQYRAQRPGRARATHRGRHRAAPGRERRSSRGRLRRLRPCGRQSALSRRGARHGRRRPRQGRRQCHAGGALDRWVRFMAAMARPGGTATLDPSGRCAARDPRGARRALRWRRSFFRSIPGTANLPRACWCRPSRAAVRLWSCVRVLCCTTPITASGRRWTPSCAAGRAGPAPRTAAVLSSGCCNP